MLSGLAISRNGLSVDGDLIWPGIAAGDSIWMILMPTRWKFQQSEPFPSFLIGGSWRAQGQVRAVLTAITRTSFEEWRKQLLPGFSEISGQIRCDQCGL